MYSPASATARTYHSAATTIKHAPTPQELAPKTQNLADLSELPISDEAVQRTYLIRHVSDKSTEVPLSELDLQLITELAKNLSRCFPKHAKLVLVSSTAQRTQQTARIIFEELSKTHPNLILANEVYEGFNERHLGASRALPAHSEIYSKYAGATVLAVTSNINAVNQNKSFELNLTNFLPGGKWTPCDEKGKFIDSDRAMWTRDSLSGAVYLNQPTDHLRFKLSFLTGFLAGIIGGNAISLTINAAYRTLKVSSLSHFWLPISCIDQNKDDNSYRLKTRCVEFAKDIARIVATPFAWLGLFFASWVGAFDPRENGPRDGAKIFSSIEIAMYGGTMEEGHFGWAPCYQPNATIHGLGGDINRERAC